MGNERERIYTKRVPVGLSEADDKHLNELCGYYNVSRATFMRTLLRVTYESHTEKLKKKKEKETKLWVK